MNARDLAQKLVAVADPEAEIMVARRIYGNQDIIVVKGRDELVYGFHAERVVLPEKPHQL